MLCNNHRQLPPVAATIAFAICGFMLLSIPANVSADVVTTYDIDISAEGVDSGDIIRVFGTITLDPDIVDTSNAIFDSSLFIQRAGGTAVELTNVENLGGNSLISSRWAMTSSSEDWVKTMNS